MKAPPEVLAYYSGHGPVTDPGPHRNRLRRLPGGIRDLARSVQGLVIHAYRGEWYHTRIDDSRRQESGLRWVRLMLDRLLEIEGSPLTEARPAGSRLVGTCRDFAVLTVAALREGGIPARARCGFAPYFTPGRFDDHWVCEYWDRERGRWVLVDAQLDQVHVERLGLEFDPCDLPRDRFLVAGRAWTMCRQEGVDPDLFGIHDLKGLWFVQANVIRDVLALSKIEVLPWDAWGPMSPPGAPHDRGGLDVTDSLAPLSLAPDDHHGGVLGAVAPGGRLEAPGWWPGGGDAPARGSD